MTRTVNIARPVCWLGCLLMCIVLPSRALAVDVNWLRDTAVQRAVEYLQIDTSNPPGGEQAAAEFLADIFVREGISYETVETAPGRVNIWARLPAADAQRRRPAIMLLHAMDSPPVQADQWQRSPFSGEVAEGRIHGRGALGNKGLGVMHLQAFIALHRAGLPLNRDVIFVATADQRSGGELGLGWLVRHLPELFRDVGFVLTGGGYGRAERGTTVFHIEVGQKAPLWLRLRADPQTLTSGGATDQLLDALQAFRGHEFPLEVSPPVAAYFAALAPHQPAEWRDAFADIASIIDDPERTAALQEAYPRYYDLLRNTCSIATVHADKDQDTSSPRVEARVECTLLMHQNPSRVVAELESVLAPFDIDVRTVLSHPSGTSSTRNSVYRNLRQMLEASARNRVAVPAIGSGSGDSHFLRELGIEVYGVTPLAVTEADMASITGHDESINRIDLRRGTRMMFELLEQLVYD